MTDWNQVEATVSIGGSECKFTTIYLKQVFNGHHVFDIGVLCPLCLERISSTTSVKA